MPDQETYYEMLWDCAQCNTVGLLGDTHRHCPTCGTAQDPKRRYFPKAGEEVEAHDHKFVGTDWACAYCSSPNSAASAHCTNCGAGQDGTKPVALVQDSTALAPQPPNPPTTGHDTAWWKWALGLVALLLVAVGAMYSVSKETTVTVSGKHWEREIQIEHLARVSDSAWCDLMPSDAYAVSRSREERSTRKVEDGKDCHDERVDKGDGTFVKRKECVTRYRSEPVFDDRCHFQINRWRTLRTARATTDDAALPAWPTVGALQSGLNTLGAEREGPRHESYVLELSAAGKHWSCDVPEGIWGRYAQGASTPVKIRMTGGADCSSLH